MVLISPGTGQGPTTRSTTMFAPSPEIHRAELEYRRDRIGAAILGRHTWRRTGRRTSRREGPVTGFGTGSDNSGSF